MVRVDLVERESTEQLEVVITEDERAYITIIAEDISDKLVDECSKWNKQLFIVRSVMTDEVCTELGGILISKAPDSPTVTDTIQSAVHNATEDKETSCRGVTEDGITVNVRWHHFKGDFDKLIEESWEFQEIIDNLSDRNLDVADW